MEDDMTFTNQIFWKGAEGTYIYPFTSALSETYDPYI